MAVRERTAWADRRNATSSTIDWHGTTADARTMFRRLHPAYDACQTTGAGIDPGA